MVSYTYSLSSLVCLEEPPILLYLIFPCHLYYVIGRNRLPLTTYCGTYIHEELMMIVSKVVEGWHNLEYINKPQTITYRIVYLIMK